MLSLDKIDPRIALLFGLPRLVELRYSVRIPDDGAWKYGYERMDSGLLSAMTSDLLALWSGRLIAMAGA